MEKKEKEAGKQAKAEKKSQMQSSSNWTEYKTSEEHVSRDSKSSSSEPNRSLSTPPMIIASPPPKAAEKKLLDQLRVQTWGTFTRNFSVWVSYPKSISNHSGHFRLFPAEFQFFSGSKKTLFQWFIIGQNPHSWGNFPSFNTRINFVLHHPQWLHSLFWAIDQWVSEYARLDASPKHAWVHSSTWPLSFSSHCFFLDAQRQVETPQNYL